MEYNFFNCICFLLLLLRHVHGTIYPTKGFKLVGHVLENITVATPSDCIVKCAQRSQCLSVNYKKSGSKANICELNSENSCTETLTMDDDYDFYSPKNDECQDNCLLLSPGHCGINGYCVLSCSATGEHVCQCPHGKFGVTCQEINEYFLEFPRGDVEDYLSFNTTIGDLDTFSILFWINIFPGGGKTAAFTYSAEESIQELLVTFEKDAMDLTIQTAFTKKINIPPIDDGHWHHIAIIRDKILYKIFLDGVMIEQITDIGNSTALVGYGTFHLGQKLNELPAVFDMDYPLKGKLNQLNMWSEVMDEKMIKSMSEICGPSPGGIVDWLVIGAPSMGSVVLKRTANCTSLRNDSSYNVIMSANQTSTVPTYAMSSRGTTEDISAFTIVLWIKNRWNFANLVNYITDSGDRMNIDQANMKNIKLMFHEEKTTKSKAPSFQLEDPPHWHHFATTWESSTGDWKMFLDGSLVSLVPSFEQGHVIPKGGHFVIGNVQETVGGGMTVENSFSGSLGRVNIWNYSLKDKTIWMMSVFDNFLANGNLFSWYGIQKKAFGDITFETTPKEHCNNRGEAEHVLKFKESSPGSYVRYDNVFAKIPQQLTVCFWAIFASFPARLFYYETSENGVELQMYADRDKYFVLGIRSHTMQLLTKVDSKWHFHCITWNSAQGVYKHYIQGDKKESSGMESGVIISAGGSLLLGRQPQGFGPFVGQIAQFNIWDIALISSEIKGFSSGLVNANGNLLQWRNSKDNIVGDIEIIKKSKLRLPDIPVQNKRHNFCLNRNANLYLARQVDMDANGVKWICANPSVLDEGCMIYKLDTLSTMYDDGVHSILNTLN